MIRSSSPKGTGHPSREVAPAANSVASRIVGAFKPNGVPRDIEGTLLHLVVNPADVFADDTDRNQLHSAEEECRRQTKGPVEKRPAENVPEVQSGDRYRKRKY